MSIDFCDIKLIYPESLCENVLPFLFLDHARLVATTNCHGMSGMVIPSFIQENSMRALSYRIKTGRTGRKIAILKSDVESR